MNKNNYPVRYGTKNNQIKRNNKVFSDVLIDDNPTDDTIISGYLKTEVIYQDPNGNKRIERKMQFINKGKGIRKIKISN